MRTTEVETHKAHKAHRCEWCWQRIDEGTEYKRYRYYDGGEAATIKMHPECMDAMQEKADHWGSDFEWTPGQARPKAGASETAPEGHKQAPIVAGPLEASVMRNSLRLCGGDDGRAYYIKGHVPFDAFMAALRFEVTDDDTILKETPEHCWLRVCRDFEEGHQIIVKAAPESKGAFRATWIQDA